MNGRPRPRYAALCAPMRANIGSPGRSSLPRQAYVQQRFKFQTVKYHQTAKGHAGEKNFVFCFLHVPPQSWYTGTL